MNNTQLDYIDNKLEYFPVTWKNGIEIAKYSSIIGQVILIILFFKLFLIFQQEHSQLHVNSTMKNPKWLYVYAFGCILSAFCNCIFYYLNHSELLFKLTNNICKIIQPLTGLTWSTGRFCYYNFMLFRVLSIFQRASNLQLNKKCYYIMAVSIDIWLLFLVCVAYLCMDYALDYKYRNSCVILQTFTLFGKDSKHAMVVISIVWGIDTLITILLLGMFLWRLCKIKRTDTNINNNNTIDINKWIKRQVFIGLLCTVTSLLFVFLTVVFGYKASYFGMYDQVINCIGVALTFDWNCNMCLFITNRNNPFHVNSQALQQNVSSMEMDVTRTNTENKSNTQNGENQSIIQLQLSVVDRTDRENQLTPMESQI